MDGEAARLLRNEIFLINKKYKENNMTEFGNEHKDALKKSMLFMGIAEAIGEVNCRKLVKETFDTEKLEVLVANPLIDMQAAGVDDAGTIEMFRFILAEAFPSAVK